MGPSRRVPEAAELKWGPKDTGVSEKVEGRPLHSKAAPGKGQGGRNVSSSETEGHWG